MSNNNTFLSTLLEKEKELKTQLDAVQTTIKIFQNGHGSLVTEEVKTLQVSNPLVPATWEEAVSWKKKILFALNKIGDGLVTEIVAELRKYDTESSEEDLSRRVTYLASGMKGDKILGARTVGNKYRYYIRN